MDKEKEFKKKFVRKNAQTGEYEMSWFLKEAIEAKVMWGFIEKALANQAKENIELL